MHKVLIIIGDAAETLDTLYPYYRLQEAGYQPVVAAPSKRRYQMVMHEVKPGWTITKEWEGYSIDADIAFADIDPKDYLGILYSGGRAPEYIRYDKDLVQITRAFFDANKPIASVCHGVEIPAFAGCVKGRRMATVPKCQFDLEVCGIRHRLSAGSFFQVNLEVNALLVARVLESIAALSPTKVLDLYAGAGNFSLPLAAQGHPVLMVESQGESLADARRTAEAHELPIEQLRADASRLRAGEHFFDVALLDPPRAGAPGVISQLVLTRPHALVYVSCHAPSLARDLKEATAAGYRVRELSLFDMFPQTSHVETLCVLGRGPA